MDQVSDSYIYIPILSDDQCVMCHVNNRDLSFTQSKPYFHCINISIHFFLFVSGSDTKLVPIDNDLAKVVIEIDLNIHHSKQTPIGDEAHDAIVAWCAKSLIEPSGSLDMNLEDLIR